MEQKPWKATVQGKDVLLVTAHAFHAVTIPPDGKHAFILSFQAIGENDTEPKVYTFIVPEEVNKNIDQYLADMQRLHAEVKRM